MWQMKRQFRLKVSTEARLSLDRRLIPGETHEQAEREIRDALAVLEERYPEFSYELELISDRPFLQTEPDSAVPTFERLP